MNWNLAGVVGDLTKCRGVFVSLMPDALLYDAWIRHDQDWDAEAIAAYFGDLFRANRQALKALNTWSEDMQITIESRDMLLILKELRGDFVLGVAYESSIPLGMMRLEMKKVLQRVLPLLPAREVEERPRAMKIMDYLKRYAPDPHTVEMRVSLITGIDIAELEDTAHLKAEQIDQLEEAAKDIMGLEELNV